MSGYVAKDWESSSVTSCVWGIASHTFGAEEAAIILKTTMAKKTQHKGEC